jgi:hypothetical protein
MSAFRELEKLAAWWRLMFTISQFRDGHRDGECLFLTRD